MVYHYWFYLFLDPRYAIALSIDLSVSFLLFLEVLTVSLDVCDFSAFSTVSIFFADKVDVLASLSNFLLEFPSLSTVSILVFVGVIDATFLLNDFLRGHMLTVI